MAPPPPPPAPTPPPNQGDPGVTFVIPCYNHGQFVHEAVRSCLDQQDASVHVVVVDDGSDDGSTPNACDEAAERDPRVNVIHQPNAGLSAARNTGLRAIRELHLRTEYVSFLDADDWVEPTFVRTLDEAIRAEASDDVSHAYCQERLVGLADMVWEVPDWDPMLEMVTNLHPVTTLIRTERVEQVGGFDETMNQGYEDWDLWLRFVSRGWRGVRVREPLFVWRRHSETTMVVEAGARHDTLFARLVENHRDLYAKHAQQLILLSNELLRRADASWLDEDGRAIPLRDMRAHVEHLIQHVKGEDERRDAMTQEFERIRLELTDALQKAEHRARTAEHERDELASLAAVRAFKRWRRLVDNAPGPIGWVLRGVHGIGKRILGGRSRA